MPGTDVLTDPRSFLASAAILGLSAGLSPGPLLALVISQALRWGKAEGMKVALTPLITDAPIIVIAVWVVHRAGSYGPILTTLALVGAAYLAYLGWETWKAQAPREVLDRNPRSLLRGVAANLLNPQPYLYWTTIGAPLLLASHRTNPVMPWCFLLGFYTCLVGSKIVVAWLVAGGRDFLRGTAYRWIMRCLGLALFLLAFRLALWALG
ncbi:MAG TPA: LysE family translocator [Acidobacteriota bacterium]|nr:LysE family translocator [Acidobacteriota bacterium]